MNLRIRKLRKHLRAQVRYVRIVFQEFRNTVLIFLSLLIVGTVLFHSSELRVGYLEALYKTFVMITLQPIEPFPQSWYLQILAFLIPILGITILAEGIVRFSFLLFAKHHNEKEWIMALASTYRNHTVIVGLGNVGYRIYEHLKALQIDMAAIEMNEKSPFVDILGREGVPVVIGDARREEYLKMLQVQDARNLLAVTNDDLTNLEVAIDARRINPNIRVFLRMFDQTFAKKIEEQFGFGFVFSTSAFVAPAVAGMVVDPTVKNAFYLHDQLIVVAELVVQKESDLIGKKPAELVPLNVVSISRNADLMMFPRAETELQLGDRVVLQTTPEALEKLHLLNAEKVLWE